MPLLTIIRNWLSGKTEPADYEMARASYGHEPYRTAQDVSIKERVEAVLSHNVKYILRDVIGLERLNAIKEQDFPKAFRKHLPVNSQEVMEYVREFGLPKRIAIYGEPSGQGTWIHQTTNGNWVVSEIDERGMQFDKQFHSKWDAEKSIIEYLVRAHAAYWTNGHLLTL